MEYDDERNSWLQLHVSTACMRFTACSFIFFYFKLKNVYANMMFKIVLHFKAINIPKKKLSIACFSFFSLISELKLINNLE